MTTDLIISGLLLMFALGFVAGGVLMDVWRVQPTQKELWRVKRRTAVKHLGTPYLKTTYCYLADGQEIGITSPGVRLVDGEPHYSSEWLDDRRSS